MLIKYNNRLAGPTPIPSQVLEAQLIQNINHRGHYFKKVFFQIAENLKTLIGIKNMPIVLTSSGTGGLESSIINTMRRGETVLSIQNGEFSERFAAIAKIHGLKIIDLNFLWGSSIDMSLVKKTLKKIKKIDAVLITHCETSTGVLNPLPDLIKLIKEHSNALILVDGVSSCGATPIKIDEWGIDIFITASQKALMCPPGLAIVGVSNRVVEIVNQNLVPNYYFNFKKMLDSALYGMTAYTPATSLFFSLDAALKLIMKEGLDKVYSRHNELGLFLRESLLSVGLKIFSEKGYESPSVTTVVLPNNYTAEEICNKLEKNYKILVNQGRGPWKKSHIRIGHMGYVNKENLVDVITSLKEVIF